MRQQDAEIHQIGARRAHQEVDEAGAQGLGSLFVDDQEVRGPGHQLPEDVEVAELVRGRDADQRAGHQEGEEVVAIGGRGAADVADRIDDHQAADAGEQQREQSRGRVEAAVQGDDGDGRDRQQDGGDVAPLRRSAADEVDGEAADIGDEDGRRPRRLELRHAFGAGEAGQARGEQQERRRPQADENRQRRQRPGDGQRRARRRRELDRSSGRLEADLLDDQDVIDRGDDGRQRAGERDQPLALLDRRIEDNELRERALERRQPHHREHAEAKQRRRDRHARTAAGKVVEIGRAGAADQMPAGGEHEAAHRRLVAEVHQRPGVARRSADAEADQHVAELGDGRNRERPGEVGQAEEGRDLAEKQNDRPYCSKRRRRRHGDRQMVQHGEKPFPPDAFRPSAIAVAPSPERFCRLADTFAGEDAAGWRRVDRTAGPPSASAL